MARYRLRGLVGRMLQRVHSIMCCVLSLLCFIIVGLFWGTLSRDAASLVLCRTWVALLVVVCIGLCGNLVKVYEGTCMSALRLVWTAGTNLWMVVCTCLARLLLARLLVTYVCQLRGCVSFMIAVTISVRILLMMTFTAEGSTCAWRCIRQCTCMMVVFVIIVFSIRIIITRDAGLLWMATFCVVSVAMIAIVSVACFYVTCA